MDKATANQKLNDILASASKLPREEQKRFACVCVDRIVPLYTTFWRDSSAFRYQRSLNKITELLWDYSHSPRAKDRQAIEELEDEVDKAEIACAANVNGNTERMKAHRVTIAVLFLMKAALNNNESPLTAVTEAIGLMVSVCDCPDILVKTLENDIMILEGKQPGMLRPIWRFGKPSGWPSEAVSSGAQ